MKRKPRILPFLPRYPVENCRLVQLATRGNNVVYPAKQEKKQNHLPLMRGRTARQHHSLFKKAFPCSESQSS